MENDLFNDVENKYFSDDFEGAALLCTECAASGNKKCIRFMGWLYYTGKGVEENLDEALKWFCKAAALDDAEAFFGKGSVYYVQENYEQSFLDFQHSAKLGYIPALLRVGMMYKAGTGVSVNKNKAYEYYSAAAMHENLIAKRLKAKMLFGGHKGWFGRIKAVPLLFTLTFQALVVSFRDKNDQRLMW